MAAINCMVAFIVLFFLRLRSGEAGCFLDYKSMRLLDYEWAKPIESLSLISQNCAVWLYMAEPFRLIARSFVDLLSRSMLSVKSPQVSND